MPSKTHGAADERHSVRVFLTLAVFLGAAILAAFTYSTAGLYAILAQVRSIYAVDVQALSLEGDLQYQTQESRQCFLHALIPSIGEEDRMKSVRLLREADLQISLLTGKITVLTGDRKRLRRFADRWEEYTEFRDTSVELALQGRSPEALAVEDQRSRAAYESASSEIQRAKRDLERSSENKVEATWEALRRACIEESLLLIAAFALAGCLAVLENKRRVARRGQIRAARELGEREARFRSIFEEAAVGIVTTDVSGKILSANKAIGEIAGYNPMEIVGMNAESIMAQDHQRHSAEALSRVANGDFRNYRAERRILRRDGRAAWIRLSVSVAKKEGAPAEVIALCEDITERKLAREALSHQATHDSLTGLANRRCFEERLAEAIGKASQKGSGVALLYLDLDGFKLINDTMGHAAGDSLLRTIAGRLESLDGPELLARVGGDEFTAIVTGEPGDESVAALARRMLAAVRAPFDGSAEGLRVGASVGISWYPRDGATEAELCQAADAAMFHARRNNRGVHVFDTAMKQAMQRRLSIRKLLNSALERHELSAHFQPLYDLSTGDLVRFEALCRWKSGELGDVSPAEFIPAAEESGLITEIGRAMLLEACTQATYWQHGGPRPIQVAVNVSAVQFSRDDFPTTVREALLMSGLPPQRLELELTESVLVRDPEDSVRKMETLRAMGVSISIDDFGTGYSSLSYLQNMPVNALKIDRSFTSRIESSATAITMIRSVIAMGRTLGLRVVTEGVENARQLDIVRQLGSDEAQGFFLGRPVTAEKARRLAFNATFEDAELACA